MTGTPSTRQPIPAAITETGIIAIVRGSTDRYLYEACAGLIEAGVRCLEVTTNTPGVYDVITQLSAEWGTQVTLGVGTVTSTDHVEAAVQAGATFIVSPNVDLDVGAHAATHSIGWYPGALTPTEVFTAWNAGATAVKIFPVGPVGGPAYLRQLRAPIDRVPMIPTGGVSLEQISDYIRAGATAVGLGGPLLGDALQTGDISALEARAAEALAAVSSAKATS